MNWTKTESIALSTSLVLTVAGSADFTCVLLREHRPVDRPVKDGHPVLLLLVGLAGEEELPLWRYYGDAKLPVVTLNAAGETGKNGIAVVRAADEHLAPRIGVLQGDGERSTPLRCH